MAELTKLLPAACGGDREAQSELYRLVEPELRLVATSWLRRFSATGAGARVGISGPGVSGSSLTSNRLI